MEQHYGAGSVESIQIWQARRQRGFEVATTRALQQRPAVLQVLSRL